MPRLAANSESELSAELANVQLPALPRLERTTEFCERWSTCRMLAAYAKAGLLSYPISVEPRDRPDVLMQVPGMAVGIEITEAVPEDQARVDAMRAHLGEDGAYMLSEFLPTDMRRSKEDIKAIARGERSGDGWEGDGPESQWADAMLCTIQRKILKMQSAEFERFDEDWLLIYDDWPLPAVDLDRASTMLNKMLQTRKADIPFKRIIIESGREVVTFVESGFVIHPIPRLWTHE